MSLWYAIYEAATNDVKGAGFFAQPDQVEPGTGNSLSAGQAGDIPNDLLADDGSSNYTYNTGNGLVQPKS